MSSTVSMVSVFGVASVSFCIVISCECESCEGAAAR
jgi:hypothetical protein